MQTRGNIAICTKPFVFEEIIFPTLGFKLENLSRTLKRFEGVCTTNLLDFSELGTFGLANWQRDKVVRHWRKYNPREFNSQHLDEEKIKVCVKLFKNGSPDTNDAPLYCKRSIVSLCKGHNLPDSKDLWRKLEDDGDILKCTIRKTKMETEQFVWEERGCERVFKRRNRDEGATHDWLWKVKLVWKLFWREGLEKIWRKGAENTLYIAQLQSRSKGYICF